MKLFTYFVLSAVPAMLFADPGGLARIDKQGRVLECPLKHTAVKAEISGSVAQVEVRQDFRYESSDTIEAVYKFPLPAMAAVNSYEMRIGDRVIRG